MTRTSLAVVIILCSAYLSLMRLGNATFWDDEAHVGIIARNFLTTGTLSGWDGRNLLAYKNGALLDASLRTINPPLQHLLTAASFWVFGPSTWSGRFPFVLAGLISLALLAHRLRQDAGPDSGLWLYGLSVFAFSVVFLLNIRQCRYYALTLLFSLLTYHTYRHSLTTGRARDFLLLALSAALLFYSNYLLGAAFLLALALVHLVFRGRACTAPQWRGLALAVTLFAAVTVPYAVSFRIWARPDLPAVDPLSLHRLTLLWWNLRDLNLLGGVPVAFAAGLVYLAVRGEMPGAVMRMTYEWLLLALGFVWFLALLSPQSPQVTTMAELRYLLPATPFLAAVAGTCLWALHQRSKAVALVVWVLTLSTNLLALAPLTQPFRWLLPAYIAEVHADYPTASRAVVDYLEAHAAPDDLVFAYPTYENYPLLFYLGDHIRLCCQLDRRTWMSPDTLARLQAPLHIDHHFPDWVVAYGTQPGLGPHLGYFSRPHQENGVDAQYRYPLATVLNVYWDATQRPELPWHHFGPRTDFDLNSEAVYIFRRRRSPAPQQAAASDF